MDTDLALVSGDSGDAGRLGEHDHARARGLTDDAGRIVTGIAAGILDALDSDEFARDVCRAVFEQLPAARVSLGQVHRKLGRFRAAYWPLLPPAEEGRLLATFGRHLLQHPGLRAALHDGAGNHGPAWDGFDPQSAFGATALYRQCYEPAGITDQLLVPLGGPDRLAIGMAIDRAGGRFSPAERDAVHLLRDRLGGVFARLYDSRLAPALASVGWTRLVVEVSGEVIERHAPGVGARSGRGAWVSGEPWWAEASGVLAEGPILHGGAEPRLWTIRADGAVVIVERPLLGHPTIHVSPARPAAGVPLADHPALTGRQREVAALLVRGMSARQIAEELHISLATARSHVAHVYDRLHVNNRAQAVALLLDRGDEH